MTLLLWMKRFKNTRDTVHCTQITFLSAHCGDYCDCRFDDTVYLIVPTPPPNTAVCRMYKRYDALWQQRKLSHSIVHLSNQSDCNCAAIVAAAVQAIKVQITFSWHHNSIQYQQRSHLVQSPSTSTYSFRHSTLIRLSCGVPCIQQLIDHARESWFPYMTFCYSFPVIITIVPIPRFRLNNVYESSSITEIPTKGPTSKSERKSRWK